MNRAHSVLAQELCDKRIHGLAFPLLTRLIQAQECVLHITNGKPASQKLDFEYSIMPKERRGWFQVRPVAPYSFGAWLERQRRAIPKLQAQAIRAT